MTDRFDGSYDRDFIINNPIPARCKKCKRQFVDGELFTCVDYDRTFRLVLCKDAIQAPTLITCRCFYCWGELLPLDANAYARRLETLHLYRLSEQRTLNFDDAQ